ncbi:MAG: DUF362 domain-containing protein [bacterium]
MAEKEKNNFHIPDFLQYKSKKKIKSQVYFIKPGNSLFNINDSDQQEKFNDKIYEVLLSLKNFELAPPVMIKVHIGEPSCNTRMLPVFTRGIRKFLKKKKINQVAFGDTTVVYSGPRGYKENGPKAKKYINLAKDHGWDNDIPFVVLDRPETSDSDNLSFDQEQHTVTIDNPERFHDFSISGGLLNSGSVIHNPHCTLHGLAHFALCVKGITMGLAGRKGKLTMHQSYYPVFDEDECIGCFECVESCPEDALQEGKEYIPVLDKSRCIGCAECMANCPNEAIEMEGAQVDNWKKGTDTIPYRMIDYLMGIMNGRWKNMVNVAHLYNITSLCDCVDVKQKPICNDIGFLIGENPLAVDNAAIHILDKQLKAEGVKTLKDRYPSDDWEKVFGYARDTYGVITEPELIEVEV